MFGHGGIDDRLEVETGAEQFVRNREHAAVISDHDGDDMGRGVSHVDAASRKQIAHELLRAGLYLQPIIYPAVAKHRSRFRISISAAYTTEQMDRAADILINVLRAEGVLSSEDAA